MVVPASRQEPTDDPCLWPGNSGRGSVVVIQRAAQTFPAVHGTCIRGEAWFGLNDSIVQSLVIAFAMVMGHEILNSCPQGAFSKQDQPFRQAVWHVRLSRLRTERHDRAVLRSPKHPRSMELLVDTSSRSQ